MLFDYRLSLFPVGRYFYQLDSRSMMETDELSHLMADGSQNGKSLSLFGVAELTRENDRSFLFLCDYSYSL